jgi:hypothetical protein
MSQASRAGDVGVYGAPKPRNARFIGAGTAANWLALAFVAAFAC